METKRRRLLLADDSITIQKVVNLTFSDEGMDVRTVGAGDEAIRELEESGPPDVLLADVHMPGLSGYEVCERVKLDARWRHVPVILLAGAFEPFDEAEARRVGADEVLSKPFQSIKDLIGKVGSLLGGGKHEADKAPAPLEERAAAAAGEASSAPRANSFEKTMRADTALRAKSDARASEPAPAFADYGMDDEMIEATPAEQFGAAEKVERPAPTERSFRPEPVAERRQEADQWVGESRNAQVFSAAPREAVAEAQAAAAASPQTFAARAAGATAADEVLLDLGQIEPSDQSDENDDFVLDLDFDEPPPSSREPQSRPDAARAFAEAAHGFGADAARGPSASGVPAFDEGAAPRDFIEPQVVPSEETARPREDLTVEGDIARPPFESQPFDTPVMGDARTHEGAQGAVSFGQSAPQVFGAAAEQGIDPQQLSPEVIDRIARRAVEMMSERAVQEIAWEVVPALAERLITQRLDELSPKGQ